MMRIFWLLVIFLFLQSINIFAAESVIRVPILSISKGLNPSKQYDISSQLINRQVFEQLYVYDENGNLNPSLASHHKWSNDQKLLTVFINKGHAFSDGTLVNAKSVVLSILNAIRTLGKEGDWASAEIKGYPTSPSVREVDPYTIEIEFKHSFGVTRQPFLNIC